MENYRKSPLSVRPGGMELKVYRIGGTPDIKQNNRAEEDPNTLKGIHTHFTYEIFFVTQGTLRLVTEDFTTTYQRAVVIIPPKLKHYSFPDSEGCFCLLFSPEESRVPGNSAKSKKTILEKTIKGILELPLSEDIAFYIKKLSEKSKTNTAAAERDCELLTALIFNGVFEHTAFSQNNSFQHAEASQSHIGAIENYINSNLRSKITLSDVAANVFLSTR